MYDILQLNDMVVPELLDIAEQQKIPNAKKLDKQELIYKILDKQAIMNAAVKNEDDDKPKRKRIVKTSTANSTEDAEVMQEKSKPEPKAAKKAEPVKKPVKREEPQQQQEEEEDEEDLQPITSENSTIPPAIASLLQEEDIQQPEATPTDDNGRQYTPKQPLQRRDQSVFNIEFDGIILGEGVLEMMPDGYGFL